MRHIQALLYIARKKQEKKEYTVVVCRSPLALFGIVWFLTSEVST